MKTTITYLIVFITFALAANSCKGYQENMKNSNKYTLVNETMEVDLNKPQKPMFLCDNNTTSVFIHEPKNIDEKAIKSYLIYKEKLYALNETVKRIIKRN